MMVPQCLEQQHNSVVSHNVAVLQIMAEYDGTLAVLQNCVLSHNVAVLHNMAEQ